MKRSITSAIGEIVAGIACVVIIAAAVFAGLYFGGVVKLPGTEEKPNVSDSTGGDQSGNEDPNGSQSGGDQSDDEVSEPESKLLQMANNVTAVNNVGTWYFWIDGDEGVDYEFAENGLPSMTGRTMTATLNQLNAGKYFYFRYQPLSPTDPDDDGNFIMYNIHFDVTVTAACSIRYGTVTTFGGFKTEEIEAGETVSLTYAAQANSVQPFSVSIVSTETPVTISLTITEISYPVIFG